jgi:16S rRNA (cytidine1402-2'-O)-methyltransferase
MATLYIIGTPIGNLEDITLRALRILKEVDLILCEDTQMTRRLLDRYGIATRTESYHAQSTAGKLEHVLRLLEDGKNLALVSDAGTPGISDPGTMLVAAVRERFNATVAIVPIPGPSAVTAALSASGLPTAEFVFLGFLPHKKGRQTLFKEIAISRRTVAFYESPHRIMKTLTSLVEALGGQASITAVSTAPTTVPTIAPSIRKIVIAREITKIFEEIIFVSAQEALAYFTDHPDKVRGEFTVLVGPA